jgi:hypothetical protein
MKLILKIWHDSDSYHGGLCHVGYMKINYYDGWLKSRVSEIV